MAARYANDWEDPRLSVQGFVVDYIVWRLAVDGFEWRDAPIIREGAEEEHAKMRTICAQVEENGAWSWIEWIYLDVFFGFYCETMELFARSLTNNPKEISYEQVAHLIAISGIICKEKARKGKVKGISDVVKFTIRLIDSRIRASWRDTGRSWYGCWIAASFMIEDRVHRRPSVILPYSPFHPDITVPCTFYGKYMLFASAGVLGMLATYRIAKVIQAISSEFFINEFMKRIRND